MKENNQHLKSLKHARVWLLSGLVLIFFAPFVFTLPAFWSKLDFSKTSSVGDTIGGITSPIVGILGAVLVFYALIEQVKANVIIQKQIEEQKQKEMLQNESNQINQLYQNLKDSIDNFNYVSLDPSYFGQGTYVNGSEAIYKLFNDFYCDCHDEENKLQGNPKFTELTSILEICDVVLKKLEASCIPDRETLITLTRHQFKYRIFPRLNSDVMNLNKHYCDTCEKNHGLPDRMVQLIQSLIKSVR